MITDVIKILVPAALAFFIGIIMTPFLANFLYKNKMWKKSSVKNTIDGAAATITGKLHNDEARKTPRMGGILIWGSVGVTIGILRELYKVRKPFQACVFRLNSQGKVVPFSFQGDPLDEPQEATE